MTKLEEEIFDRIQEVDSQSPFRDMAIAAAEVSKRYIKLALDFDPDNKSELTADQLEAEYWKWLKENGVTEDNEIDLFRDCECHPGNKCDSMGECGVLAVKKTE